MSEEERPHPQEFGRDLDWLPSDLEPVAMRLARVDECIYRIGELASAWSMNNPLSLQTQRRRGRLTTVVTSIRPVPPMAWLLFSEAVNHLRAALDNTVWHLVSQAHPDMAESVARRVAMPVHTERERYDQWVKARVKDGLTVLDAGSTLEQRIRSLQPFADDTVGVASIGAALAAWLGNPVEVVHPLELLQGYSNDDKHRAIRVAIPRARHSRLDQPLLGQAVEFREMSVGDILAEHDEGEIVPMESSLALLVPRPSPYVEAVAPAGELADIHRWVSHVAVPQLASGSRHELPASASLVDDGVSGRQRLLGGGRDTAKERLDVLMARMWQENEARPPLVPEIVDFPCEGHGGSRS